MMLSLWISHMIDILVSIAFTIQIYAWWTWYRCIAINGKQNLADGVHRITPLMEAESKGETSSITLLNLYISLTMSNAEIAEWH